MYYHNPCQEVLTAAAVFWEEEYLLKQVNIRCWHPVDLLIYKMLCFFSNTIKVTRSNCFMWLRQEFFCYHVTVKASLLIIFILPWSSLIVLKSQSIMLILDIEDLKIIGLYEPRTNLYTLWDSCSRGSEKNNQVRNLIYWGSFFHIVIWNRISLRVRGK